MMNWIHCWAKQSKEKDFTYSSSRGFWNINSISILLIFKCSNYSSGKMFLIKWQIHNIGNRMKISNSYHIPTTKNTNFHQQIGAKHFEYWFDGFKSFLSSKMWGENKKRKWNLHMFIYSEIQFSTNWLVEFQPIFFSISPAVLNHFHFVLNKWFQIKNKKLITFNLTMICVHNARIYFTIFSKSGGRLVSFKNGKPFPNIWQDHFMFSTQKNGREFPQTPWKLILILTSKRIMRPQKDSATTTKLFLD